MVISLRTPIQSPFFALKSDALQDVWWEPQTPIGPLSITLLS